MLTVKQYLNFKKLFKKISDKGLHGEDKLSYAVNVLLRNHVLSGTPIAFFHVPNESKRTITYARRMEAIGLIPGAPDFVISSKNKTIFLELKAHGKKNNLSENQKAFKYWADDIGIPYYVATSEEEVSSIIENELGV